MQPILPADFYLWWHHTIKPFRRDVAQLDLIEARQFESLAIATYLTSPARPWTGK